MENMLRCRRVPPALTAMFPDFHTTEGFVPSYESRGKASGKPGGSSRQRLSAPSLSLFALNILL